MSKAYELVTERIVKALESGTIPWKKSWSEGAGLGEHQNLISQHQYRGINAMVTSAQGYEKPYWLTFKQAADHGGHVRKGEKGTPIVYWQFGTRSWKRKGNKSGSNSTRSRRAKRSWRVIKTPRRSLTTSSAPIIARPLIP
jgi:antirestriction protein ArdC